MINLPNSFVEKYRKLMSEEEFNKFIASFDEKYLSGIRYNSLKIDEEKFKEIIGLIEKVPWSKNGYYYDSDLKLSTNPYYHTGLYYFQEPSAMFPAEVVAGKKDEKILDLCAAPGGKTTQIAFDMENTGLLVSNEINPKRARALKKNVELYGLKNTIVTNTTGKKLSEYYGSYFDKVLIDAPCSGEGTFRKDKRSLKEYENYADSSIVKIQRDIIDYGVKLLKVGGILVYSTCTFNPDENEANISYLLDNYDFELEDIEKIDGISDGYSDWLDNGNKELNKAIRFFPHKVKGEGHFVAKLKKLAGEEVDCKKTKNKWLTYKELDIKVRDFLSGVLSISLEDKFFILVGENVYLFDNKVDFYKEHNIIYMGVLLGKLNKYGFIPSQSFIMSLKRGELAKILDLELEDANRYIKGETLSFSSLKGYYGVCYDGYTLGWCKVSNGVFKNLYEKNWRKSY